MVIHEWPPATKSSVVLAHDVERHLSETITATTLGRHPQRDTRCSWCFWGLATSSRFSLSTQQGSDPQFLQNHVP
jgi:hypothetical protein